MQLYFEDGLQSNVSVQQAILEQIFNFSRFSSFDFSV